MQLDSTVDPFEEAVARVCVSSPPGHHQPRHPLPSVPDPSLHSCACCHMKHRASAIRYFFRALLFPSRSCPLVFLLTNETNIRRRDFPLTSLLFHELPFHPLLFLVTSNR
jgi:hypothetical protein